MGSLCLSVGSADVEAKHVWHSQAVPHKACISRCKVGLLETFSLSVADIAHLNGSLGHESSYIPGTIHPDWPACTPLLPSHMHTIR